MRNWFNSGCDCNNPEPVVGVIAGGKKYPFGSVKQSDYDEDMKHIGDKIHSLEVTVATLAGVSERVDTMSADVAALKGDNTNIKTSITNITASIKSITESISSLDARVTALEGSTPTPTPTPTKFYVYWGASATATPTSSTVTSLAFSTYTETALRTISVACNDEYCYYCIPATESDVQFEVSGFTGGFENPTQVAVLDSEGVTTTYKVYRSSQKLNGTAPIKVKR